MAWLRIQWQELLGSLVDNGCMVNAVTPEFVKAHSLDAGPFIDLVDSGTVSVNSFGGLCSQPLGYVIIKGSGGRGMKGYDEDQVALVIPDTTEVWLLSASYFRHTDYKPNYKHGIKESKIDELSVSLEWVKNIILVGLGLTKALHVKRERAMNQTRDLTDVNESCHDELRRKK